ncbi:hypothetical protein ZIOFF_043626 [Zingiber officinale]|uniref:Protein kinase domain-containing protein n=1 Tax=Zingiber officinale TaxID=94328 RepID=A0A8J5FVB1_ZINOF|nr:hypothetical protein ZIOFF_043626 [Zingiber officinale]
MAAHFPFLPPLMTTPISIEDVRREVKILKALSNHNNLVKFYDACEDALNVYVIMEGGRYLEEDAKAIVIQIVSVIAFCHLQGVVHRDLNPEGLLQNATEAMKEGKLEPLSYRKMDFEEFCAATISPHHLEALDGWEQMTSTAFEHFELEGKRAITVKELAQELSLPAANYSVLRSWIRPEDCKFNFLGYTRYLHGVTIRSANTRHW